MSVPDLCTALPGETDLAGYTILAATAGHPLLGWLRGEVSEYQLRGDAALLARHAIAHGVVDWCDDRSAIAVWLRRPAPGRWPALGTRGGFDPDLAYTARIADLLATLPSTDVDAAHWQLLLLAVEPDARRTGRASALLAHRHAELDATGLAASAYVFDEPTRALLQRHGYQPRQRTVVAGGHPCWTMLRPAAGVAVTASEPA